MTIKEIESKLGNYKIKKLIVYQSMVFQLEENVTITVNYKNNEQLKTIVDGGDTAKVQEVKNILGIS